MLNNYVLVLGLANGLNILSIVPGALGSEEVMAEITSLTHTCISDSDCEIGQFCWSNVAAGLQKICTSCFNCKLKYNREERKKCSRSFYECGQCLPGFMEVIASDGDPKDACEMKSWEDETAANLMPAVTPGISNSGGVDWGWIAFGILFLLIVIGIIFWWKREALRQCVPCPKNGDSDGDTNRAERGEGASTDEGEHLTGEDKASTASQSDLSSPPETSIEMQELRQINRTNSSSG